MNSFKKYPDRRLYDPQRKRFTNLQFLITLIRAGEEIQVTCSKTGKDCTDEVYLSAFLMLPEIKSILTGRMLYRLIRSTGPGTYNRRLAERISLSFDRLMTDVDDLDSFYAQLKPTRVED